MTEIEVEGKTVEEAIQQGLNKLGCSRNNVEIKILDEGTSGLFGLMGTKPARVKLITKDSVKTQKAIDFVLAQNKVQEVISTILKLMNVSYEEINTSLMASRILVDVKTKESNLLIGKSGTTLEALENIVNLIISKNEKTRTKVVLDIEGYRRRQEDRLQSMAKKAAQYVKKTGKIWRFDPMPAHERRIIHMALKNEPNINTFSEGEGKLRKVIIKPKKSR